jgi:biotin carboxyl carrier protein
MKVEVNGNEYDVELLGNKARINGKEIALKLDQDELTISDNKKFHLDFLQEGEPSFMIINGMAYDVLRSVSADTVIKEVKAPISGKIIDVSVSPGAKVNRGALLVVLEAMKMENQIRSPLKGRVKEIKVKKGQSVRSGDVLLIFE